MDKPVALPWIGTNYNRGFNGKRVLVLGESHYCADVTDFTADLTRSIIRDLYDENSEHEGYKNTYTKFVKAMTGEDTLTASDKKLFWNSVAFYNYVQVPISGARVAPTSAEFKGSRDAFFHVLEELRPDICIAWGARLYNNLPTGGQQGQDYKATDGKWIESWKYFLSDGKPVVILPITHPSAAFSPAYWHGIISQLF